MIRHAPVFAVAVAVGVLLGGCGFQDGPPGPASGPTLSLAGASGVSADVRRTVTEVANGAETILSAVDTAVWAPFNDDGAAVAATDAGTPGPVGWLSRAGFDGSAWSRYGSFVDSAGVLHELRVVADGPGPWNRIEYRRNGRVVVNDVATWAAVGGGWTLDAEAVTYHLETGADVRVDVRGLQMAVARTSTGIEPFGLLAGVFDGWLVPRPLAAQFHFSACAKEWLGWGGASLLAEIAWGKFLRTKSYKDFKLATAATGAAGVALNKLVDCMVEQPDQLDPGN